MKITTMKLEELIKPKRNTRIHTEQQLKEFQRSVQMFGQIRPIVIDENNTILAGNGLYDTLVAMGKEPADVYQLGIENLETLNSFLEDLQGDLDIPGFDEEILKQMVSEAEDITDKLSEYGTLDDEEIQDIKENAKRKELKIQKLESEQEPAVKSEDPLQQNTGEDNAENTVGKKFAICPKCGEKLWL